VKRFKRHTKEYGVSWCFVSFEIHC